NREKEPAPTHSNAPKHWPAVTLTQFEEPAINAILVAGELSQLHQPPASTMALMRDFVYEDGILRVPIVIDEGGTKTCVFLYSNHDTDPNGHYSAVRSLLRARENANAVYYAPQALAPAKPATVL